jgi:U3 small nucleolar RNA-associated protein 15
VSPHTLAIATSTAVKLYSPTAHIVQKTLSRFRDTVLCAEFRVQDGKLLLASDKTGSVQLFDLSSRAILRTWNPGEAHSGLQVSKLRWRATTGFVTAGDDRCVKVWDVTLKEPVMTFQGHEDYVRALTVVPDSGLIVSGSLDGTARLWDPRVPDACVATLKHGDASSDIVYSVTSLRGGTIVLTAGGSGIKVWDVVGSTSTPLKEMWNHQREVTSLTMNSDGTRVLAGGLDGHVKIYDVANWKVVHGIKYPAGILTLSLSVRPPRHSSMFTLIAGR